jgi:hypothetical protein
MPISEEQEKILNEYRGKALERLQEREYRKRPTRDDALAIYMIARSYDTPQPLMQQMSRDLRVYLLYDSLAMWLDPKAGLAAYAPEAMTAIGRHYFDDDESV